MNFRNNLNTTNRIGMYSSSSLDPSEELREKIMNSLQEMMPRMREESSRIVLERVRPLLETHKEEIELTKEHIEKAKIIISKNKDDINDKCFHNLNRELDGNIGEVCQLKNYLKKNSKMTMGSNTTGSGKLENCLLKMEEMMKVMELKSDSKFPHLEKEIVTKLAELKQFIEEKLNKFTDSLNKEYSDPAELTEDEEKLLSALELSLSQLTQIKDYHSLMKQPQLLMENTPHISFQPALLDQTIKRTDFLFNLPVFSLKKDSMFN